MVRYAPTATAGFVFSTNKRPCAQRRLPRQSKTRSTNGTSLTGHALLHAKDDTRAHRDPGHWPGSAAGQLASALCTPDRTALRDVPHGIPGTDAVWPPL